uniref:Nuclear protein MDM1 n=1 Tax=Trichuris muris TaxID=70415 RepID=A0A5S6QYU5_TRIMR
MEADFSGDRSRVSMRQSSPGAQAKINFRLQPLRILGPTDRMAGRQPMACRKTRRNNCPSTEHRNNADTDEVITPDGHYRPQTGLGWEAALKKAQRSSRVWSSSKPKYSERFAGHGPRNASFEPPTVRPTIARTMNVDLPIPSYLVSNCASNGSNELLAKEEVTVRSSKRRLPVQQRQQMATYWTKNGLDVVDDEPAETPTKTIDCDQGRTALGAEKDPPAEGVRPTVFVRTSQVVCKR